MDNLSLTTKYLKMIAPTGAIMSTATGFMYQVGTMVYLVTNGHNITRLNAQNGRRIIDSLAYPVKIEFGLRAVTPYDEGKIGISPTTIDLYEDEDFTKPRWYIHPVHGYQVDVVVIPFVDVEGYNGNARLFPINFSDFVSGYDLAISNDVFILGYPLNLNGNSELPIWKRGSVATEPSMSLNNLPMYLIDTATRPGMSGSPVIMQRSGFHARGKEIALDDLFGTIRLFAGIYSGRLGAENQVEAQLGIVWRPEVIDEIINGKIIGTVDFQNM
jgi:hypothetical protein